jgi:GGDEF domain-containing protein
MDSEHGSGECRDRAGRAATRPESFAARSRPAAGATASNPRGFVARRAGRGGDDRDRARAAIRTSSMTTNTARDPAGSPSPQKNRLSVPQMLHVMRIEFHRARHQSYPIVCLMIAVDGIDELREKHGYELKAQVMRETYGLLRKAASEHGFIGMALMSGDRVMAVFPSLEPTRGGELGRVINEGARALKLRAGDADVPVKLSLGASHSLLAETNSSFEGLVERAGRALHLAREGGGDRYVMWREAEAEIELLRGALKDAKREFAEQHAVMMEEAAELGGLQESVVLDQMQKIFAGTSRSEEIIALEKQILELAAKELFAERQRAVAAQVAEHRRQVDQLERRIAKLTSLLGVTEEELQRVLAMKNIDVGVASIYRTVQGLSNTDEQAQAKRAMMAEIFRSNLAIQKPDPSVSTSAEEPVAAVA